LLSIVGILVTFPIIIVFVYICVMKGERARIVQLKNVSSQFKEGLIDEGGEMLLWAPINWRPTVTAFCLLAVVAAIILLLSNESSVLELLLLMISTLTIVGLGIAYHFAYYLRYTGNTILIVDKSSIQEVRIKKEGIELKHTMKWTEVKNVENYTSGGGDSLGAEASGIGLVSEDGRIGIGKDNVNSSLFYYLFLHEFAKDELSYQTLSHLRSLARFVPQELLNNRLSL
jgi:hypothetical protein